MNTTERIKEIIKSEYNAAFNNANALDGFKFNHNLKASFYPGGKVAYFGMELYELKKDALNPAKYDYYTRNWVQNDCFDFAYKEGFIHLIEHCRKVFVRWLDSKARDFGEGRYKDEVNMDWIFKSTFDYVNSIVKTFYTFASQVYALEDLLKEAENVKPAISPVLITEFHEAFNGKIWNCSARTLSSVLDFSSNKKETIGINKHKYGVFYFLLHRLYDYYNISKLSKAEFFPLYLERFNLSYDSFKDNARLKPFIGNDENEAVRKQILEFMPMNAK